MGAVDKTVSEYYTDSRSA